MNIIVFEKVMPAAHDMGAAPHGFEKRRNPRFKARRAAAHEQIIPANGDLIVLHQPEAEERSERQREDQAAISKLFDFMINPSGDVSNGLIVHENRLDPARVGAFDSSIAAQMLRVYVRDFLLGQHNSSISSSFDGKLLHIDINSHKPHEDTISNMFIGFSSIKKSCERASA